MTEERTSHQDAEWAERLEAARRRVEELPPEQRRRGARLAERLWAVRDALGALRGEKPFLSERRKEEVLEDLERVKQDLDVEFRAFNREHGIPDL